jgi:hypothetical protein
MTKSMRWRIIVLQVVALLLLVGGSYGAFYGSTFATDQIKTQLQQEQIFFPKDQASGLLPGLEQYAGQQVLNGDQAHAYADKFIWVHLQTAGKDTDGQFHPYSYWSGKARTDAAAAAAATDPATKAQLTAQAAKDNATVDTLFKGDTLRAMLNQAWTMSVFAQIAYYAGFGLALAGLIVFGSLVFEAIEAVRGAENVVVVPASQIRETAGAR